MIFQAGKKYLITKEPSWSSGGRKGLTLPVVDKGDYLAFRHEFTHKDEKGNDVEAVVEWPVSAYQIS